MMRVDLTITKQVDLFGVLLYEAIRGYVDLTDELIVSIVNSSHDQAQRSQNTNPGDGWATKAAHSVRRGHKLNPVAFGHVTVNTPDPELGYMTVAVGDTVVTIAHGHQ